MQRVIRTIRLYFYSFMASLQFLTILPPIIKRPFTHNEMGNSIIFFPLIGLIIGVLLVLINQFFSNVFPGSISTILLLLFWIVLTGAIHFDGFLDSVDGLFGGKTAESRLKIMRDEYIGAFALVGGVLLILIKFFSLYAIYNNRNSALLISPAISRWAMAVCVVGFPYARNEGVGRDLKDNTSWRHVLIATIIAVLIVYIVAGWSGFFILLFAALLTVGIAGISLLKVNGMTGDIYGAVNELVEVLVLLIMAGSET